ncbi:NERD domain-containing protein [Pseudidiomarina sp.]|uniref:NERD domain-containing protein n=1 Tax=Pseudidiomarina sp. TaxID=2081707 RepID=UPI003A986637
MDILLSAFQQNTDMFKYLGAIALLLVIIKILNTSWFKGKLGEFLVNLAAKIHLDKDQYHLIKDVTLPTDDGTTQIDHIIVSIYGVFVVETKYFRGWIFGSEKQKTWTQVIYRNKYNFQNPLHQNYKHTQVLKEILQLTEEQIYSLIVFIGDSQFKSQMPDNVFFGARYINFIQAKKMPVLSTEEVRAIRDKIESNALTRSIQTSRAHRQHVKEIIEQKTNKSNSADEGVQCPKCGAQMVKRLVKRGEHQGRQFWGCSAFPKCRGVVA